MDGDFLRVWKEVWEHGLHYWRCEGTNDGVCVRGGVYMNDDDNKCKAGCECGNLGGVEEEKCVLVGSCSGRSRNYDGDEGCSDKCLNSYDKKDDY
jgi:hypothetical protein